MVSQPIVLQTWKGRNKLYKTVTVHKCTRYLYRRSDHAIL